MTQMMCWQEGNDRVKGAWHIGSEMTITASPIANPNITLASISFSCMAHGMQFMQHYHTGRIELIPTAWLKPYPVSKIEEPTK